MRKVLVVFGFLVFSIQLFAQTNAEVVDTTEAVLSWAMVDKMPLHPSCEVEQDKDLQMECFSKGILSSIITNVKYPEEARNLGISDKVWVSFIIEKNGKVNGVRIERGKHESLNKEAIRLIKLLPKMKPAEVDGKPVRMSFTVPINFRLG